MFWAIATFLFFGTMFKGFPPLLALFLAVCVYINQKNKKRCKQTCHHAYDCNKFYTYK